MDAHIRVFDTVVGEEQLVWHREEDRVYPHLSKWETFLGSVTLIIWEIAGSDYNTSRIAEGSPSRRYETHIMFPAIGEEVDNFAHGVVGGLCGFHAIVVRNDVRDVAMTLHTVVASFIHSVA